MLQSQRGESSRELPCGVDADASAVPPVDGRERRWQRVSEHLARHALVSIELGECRRQWWKERKRDSTLEKTQLRRPAPRIVLCDVAAVVHAELRERVRHVEWHRRTPEAGHLQHTQVRW